MKTEAIIVCVSVMLLLACFPMNTQSGATNSHGSPGLLGSQSTDPTDWWPMFHHDLTHSGYSTSTGPTTNQILWTYSTASYIDWSSPAVANGVVYVGAGDGKVYALNAATGTQIWNYNAHGWVDSSPAVVGGFVYVGSYYGNVYCLNAATGTEVWIYTTGNDVISSPAVVGGLVYVGSWDGKVYCLNAATGSLVWSYTTGGAVVSSPAVAGSVVYVGSEDYKVYAFNAATGALIWSYTTGDFVYSSPAVVGGVVYIGSNDRKVYALNAATGALIWSYTTGVLSTGGVWSSPAVVGGVVYVGANDCKVYALNAATGALIWSYLTQPNGCVISSPAVAGGVVYVGSYSGNVYALNAATGALIWSYATAAFPRSSPAVVGGVVYIGSGDGGKIYAFGSNAPANVVIDNVQPARSVVFQGTVERIDITVTNKGTEAESFDLVIKEQQGLLPGENYLGNLHVSSLPPGSSKVYSFTWNTMGFTPAVYQINVYATVANAKYLGAGPIYLQDIGYVILVGGIDKGNQYWIIDRLCNAVYMELRSIGFSKDRIYYLSRFDQYVNGEKINSATTLPIQQEQDAIDNWAANRVDKTEPLFLYIYGHGLKPYSSKAFLLSSIHLYDDVWQDIGIDSATWAGWLSSLRSQTGAEIYTICDFCNSGSFFSDLSPISNVTICSADQNQEAHFCNGTAWFGDPFWYTISEGKSVSQAFNVACENVRLLCNATGEVQTPLLDDDNDGSGHTGPVPNGGDGYYASSIYIGHCEWGFPWVSSSIATQYCVWPPTGNFTLWAKVENDSSLTRVWAGMIAPDWVPANDSGFLDFGSEDFEMTDQTSDGNYTINVPAVNFTDHASGPGSFTFVISAEQADNRNAIPCLVKVVFTETGQPPSDTVPPLIRVTRPFDGSIVHSVIQVNGTTSDDVCLQKCLLYVDDNLAQTITLPQASSSYFDFSLDTSSLSNGNHTVMTESYDTSNNTANDSANVYVVNDVHDIAIVDVGSSETAVFEYDDLTVTATIVNHGSYSESTNITVYANSTPIGTEVTDNLTIDGVETLTFTWNTVGFDPGNYTLSAWATSAPGEINTADNILVGMTVQIAQATNSGGGGRMPYMS